MPDPKTYIITNKTNTWILPDPCTLQFEVSEKASYGGPSHRVCFAYNSLLREHEILGIFADGLEKIEALLLHEEATMSILRSEIADHQSLLKVVHDTSEWQAFLQKGHQEDEDDEDDDDID